MKHTPGPYNAYDTSTGWVIRAGADQHVIAEGMRKEDAAFLSAAPELLEALKAQPIDPRGCTCLSMTAYNCPFHLRENAITKAEGRNES